MIQETDITWDKPTNDTEKAAVVEIINHAADVYGIRIGHLRFDVINPERLRLNTRRVIR